MVSRQQKQAKLTTIQAVVDGEIKEKEWKLSRKKCRKGLEVMFQLNLREKVGKMN